MNDDDLILAYMMHTARVCHEVNRAYCQAIGDDSQPSWEDAPDWQKESALLGVDLHTHNDVGPEASHESWMAQKIADGWEYGLVKDPVLKIHPCIKPFAELSKEQQIKDHLFRAVVHAMRPPKAQPQE
jgi:hypothetical protein